MCGAKRAAALRPYAICATNGLICSARCVPIAVSVLPWCCRMPTPKAMNLHLAEISRNVAAGAHALVVLDGAGWHQAGGDLRVPANISLLHLPPYSPELNPVENVWEYLRENQLSNRVYDSYDTIVDACCAAWNALITMPDRIRSIATRSWTKEVMT